MTAAEYILEIQTKPDQNIWWPSECKTLGGCDRVYVSFSTGEVVLVMSYPQGLVAEMETTLEQAAILEEKATKALKQIQRLAAKTPNKADETARMKAQSIINKINTGYSVVAEKIKAEAAGYFAAYTATYLLDI